MQDTTVLILALMQPLQLPLAIQFQTQSPVQVVTSVRQDQPLRLFALKAITSQEKVPMIAKNVQLVTTAHSPWWLILSRKLHQIPLLLQLYAQLVTAKQDPGSPLFAQMVLSRTQHWKWWQALKNASPVRWDTTAIMESSKGFVTPGTSVILVPKISETLAKSAHKDSTVLLVLLCLLDALILFIGVALAQQTSPSADHVLPVIIAWKTILLFECVHQVTSALTKQ